MCNKTENRIECEECGYPYSEALYPDDYDGNLGCYESYDKYEKHINHVLELRATQSTHYYDCKCLICR